MKITQDHRRMYPIYLSLMMDVHKKNNLWLFYKTFTGIYCFIWWKGCTQKERCWSKVMLLTFIGRRSCHVNFVTNDLHLILKKETVNKLGVFWFFGNVQQQSRDLLQETEYRWKAESDWHREHIHVDEALHIGTRMKRTIVACNILSSNLWKVWI